ncbi:TadE family protein [Klenkia sp. LSe6-5]|uniref:TadE family protein n=1 Tax=Klenkia sesuvii TaxID=3103137 RepID=A0ABU8DSR7_9ACTN
MPRRTRCTRRPGRRGERGAAAVEFALVVPLLLIFLFSIISVSRAFQVQSALSGAAREAAREFAIGNDASTARQRALDTASASAVPLASSSISISPTSCRGAASGSNITVTIRYTFQPFGSFAGGVAFPITGQAVFRCGA